MVSAHDPQILTNEIKQLGLINGAELVGFTSAKLLENGAPKGHRPSVLMSSAKSVIVLACGKKLNEDRTYEYDWGSDYININIKLKDYLKPLRTEARKSVKAIKDYLEKKNIVSVSEMHGWSGILSFRMAGYLAGIGVFGKGSFLLHPRLGPLNFLTCIITDAELMYGKPLEMDICGDCMECIKACKYGAFKKEKTTFKWIRDKFRCYDLIMNPVTLKWIYGPCNSQCVNVCPIGK